MTIVGTVIAAIQLLFFFFFYFSGIFIAFGRKLQFYYQFKYAILIPNIYKPIFVWLFSDGHILGLLNSRTGFTNHIYSAAWLNATGIMFV